MIPGVAVDNIQHAHFVQLVLQGPGRENVGHARIKARTQQGREPGFAKAVGIGPLPLVFKLGRVQGLVIGRIQIVHAAFQAGVHNVQILIRQGEIADQIRLDLPDQPAEFRHVVRVHLGGVDVHACAGLDAARHVRATGQRAAGQGDPLENAGFLGRLGALVSHHAAHAARADDQDLRHICSFFLQMITPSETRDSPVPEACFRSDSRLK